MNSPESELARLSTHGAQEIPRTIPNLCTSVARSNLAAVTSLIQTSLISLPTPSRVLQTKLHKLLTDNFKTIFHQFGSLSRLQAGDDARELVIFHQFGSLSRLQAGDDARELVIFH